MIYVLDRVASLADAWIETTIDEVSKDDALRRVPRGRVD